MRETSVLMKLDFEDRDRVWSLWVETGVRVHCLRLSYAAGLDEQTPSTTVAYLHVGDNVFESMIDPTEDTKALAEQYVDMLLTLTSEQQPANSPAYLQLRLDPCVPDPRARHRRADRARRDQEQGANPVEGRPWRHRQRAEQ